MGKRFYCKVSLSAYLFAGVLCFAQEIVNVVNFKQLSFEVFSEQWIRSLLMFGVYAFVVATCHVCVTSRYLTENMVGLRVRSIRLDEIVSVCKYTPNYRKISDITLCKNTSVSVSLSNNKKIRLSLYDISAFEEIIQSGMTGNADSAEKYGERPARKRSCLALAVGYIILHLVLLSESFIYYSVLLLIMLTLADAFLLIVYTKNFEF